MNTEKKLNQIQLQELKNKLAENENNIKACLWLLESEINENSKMEIDKELIKKRIKFFQERLNEFRNQRIELKLNIEKLERAL